MLRGGRPVKMNRQVLLASHPRGSVVVTDFRIVEAAIPVPADGEVLVRNEWLSLDPYMRGTMSGAKPYAPSAGTGESMVGRPTGEASESRGGCLETGDE